MPRQKRSKRKKRRTAIPTDPYEAWCQAEDSIGQEQEVEWAGRRLPANQVLLLRAMDVLQRGRRDEVEALRQETAEAGAHELARMLMVLLSPPTELNPTELRKKAKEDGLGADMDLPYLDLLRMLTVWRLPDTRPKPPPKLTKAAAVTAGRPALRAAVHGLKGPSLHAPHGTGAFRQRFPRAHQLAEALRYAQLEESTRSPWRRPRRPSLERFPPDSWPDLHGSSWERILSCWMDEPSRSTGDYEVMAALEALAARSDQERGAWLHRLLRAVTREIEAGRPDTAGRLTRVASEIAADLRPNSRLDSQLDELAQRLGRLASRASDDMETARPQLLWDRAHELRDDERLALARTLFDSLDWRRGRLPDELRRSVARCLALRSPSFERRLQVARDHGELLDPDELLAGWSDDLPTLQREHLLGLVHARRRTPPAALRSVLELAGMERGFAPSVDVLQACVERAPRLEGRVVRRGLERLAGRWAGRDPQPLPLISILELVQDRWGKATRKRWARSLRPALLASSRGAPTDHRERAALVVTGLAGGDKGAADRVLRGWARRLARAEDPDQANATVLVTLAWLLGLSQLLGVDEQLADWPERLVAFLRRRSRPKIAAQVDPLAHEHPCYIGGLALLHQAHAQQLGNNAVWALVRGLALVQQGERAEGRVLMQDALRKLRSRPELVRRVHASGLLPRLSDRPTF